MRVFERDGQRREVASESTIKAKWDADRECRRLLADGWVRVAGDAEELASQPELIGALRASPDDIDTYTIFADWLSEHGDPWGQLMAVQVAIAQQPKYSPRLGASARRDELDREETRLRFVHGARLWGTLGDQIIDEATQRYASDLVDAEWFCGFIRKARIQDSSVIASFAELEVVQLLRTLELRAWGWQRTTFDLFAAHPWPELRALQVTGQYENSPAQPLDARWIVPALEATPKITELAVHNSHSTDGLCIALATSSIGAQLDRLDLTTCDFTEEGIAALASGNLRLDELRLTGTGPVNAKTMLARVAKTVFVQFGARHEAD